VFLERAFGVRRDELGALHWLSCDFDNRSINVQHSYYWRRGGNLKSTKTEASAKLLPMHAILPTDILPKTNLIHSALFGTVLGWNHSLSALIVPYHPLIFRTLGSQVLEKNGGDDETRTRDLCRDSEVFKRN
jgi:hypothetical protein